jgi:microcystin degradation protein MlrC
MHRVGVIALLQESNTFLRGQTTLEHFRQEVLLRGEAVREHFANTPHEVGGFFAGLADANIEAVPIFAARALPFGAVTAECWDALLAMLREELEHTGRLDGVLVAPHGATVSELEPDADGCWLEVVRRHVGPAVPIIGTLDPHANLSPKMVAATDALCAYRTNPHVDQKARGKEAAGWMVRTLRGDIRPTQAACFPPMAINIERQCTSEPPLCELRDHVDLAIAGQVNVLCANILLGFPYADVPEMGSAALVVTNGDQPRAQMFANQMGTAMWDLRHALAGNFISIGDAVTEAATLLGPVCLLDMGDNVGGGSPGDGTLLAHELLNQRVGASLVVIYDPDAAREAAGAGVGSQVALMIGAKSDTLHGLPLGGMFRVQHLCDGIFTETEVRHGGFTKCDQGPTAIVESGDLHVMLTTKRMPPFSLQQLIGCGVDPQKYQVIVAKGVNAPLAAYQPVCPHMIRVNTPGVTTADVTQLPFTRRRRPMFPFEREMSWSPESSPLSPVRGGEG